MNRGDYMRVIKSKVMLDDDYKNVIVKEFAHNYTEVDSLTTPREIVKVMEDVFELHNMAEEHLYLLAMTTKCKPISFFEVSHGTATASLASPREILIRALLCGATNIILIHNHPSGSPVPSNADKIITHRISEAAQLVNINFCDHIVVGRDGYYSFKEMNQNF